MFEYKRDMMKRILTYGTFDLTHIGHINLLRQAKKLGDYLVVGLSTDSFNKQKNKGSIFPFEHRKVILEAIRFVDLVIAESNWEQKISDVQEFKINTFVMGDDWAGKFDYLKSYCEVIYLPRTAYISTTEIKSHIKGTHL